MAEFKSRYSELGFYVDGSLRNFRNGRYTTTDKDEIAELRQIRDVTEIKKPTKKAATKNSGKKSEKSTKTKTSDK